METDKKGSFFGEYGLVKKVDAVESVVAVSDDVMVALIAKEQFERLLAPLDDIMLEFKAGGREASKLAQKDIEPPPGMEPLQVPRSEFKKIGLLGCGGFGAVTLEQAPDGKTYAMKQLSKGYVVKCRMEASTVNEKNVRVCLSLAGRFLRFTSGRVPPLAFFIP